MVLYQNFSLRFFCNSALKEVFYDVATTKQNVNFFRTFSQNCIANKDLYVNCMLIVY